jgi:YidC/Oxa1 family membrane protein insertase
MGLFSEYREISRLLKKKHPVIFYSESRHYYQYFEKLISDLLTHTDLPLYYITSDKKDPLLLQAPARMKVVYCKWLLGFLFKQVKADVMIMTMPDIDNYFLKRSPSVKRYIYVFHAAVSTHLQYRKHAFIGYDIIFCTGEYQLNEIRKTEKLYKLPAKQLVPYGYPLISKLQQTAMDNVKDDERTILVAPSWFQGCIFDTCIEDLLDELSKLPYSIIVRSHPEYEKRYPARFRQIKKIMKTYPGMRIDENADVLQSLLAADILITDRSGIAFEFAFGIGKPVLFIETALKQTNPDWKEINIEPVENSYRSVMGVSILPSQLNQLQQKIAELNNLAIGFRSKMQIEESSLFYNNESYYKKAVECIKEITKES